MSTEWSHYCVDCKSRGPVELNHGAQQIANMLRHRAWLEAIPPELDAGGPYDQLDTLARWFAEHKGHQIVVRSEYGCNFEDCAKWCSCPHCNHTLYCTRPEGHEGKCGLREEIDPPEVIAERFGDVTQERAEELLDAACSEWGIASMSQGLVTLTVRDLARLSERSR